VNNIDLVANMSGVYKIVVIKEGKIVLFDELEG
jgi:hypothetical protein